MIKISIGTLSQPGLQMALQKLKGSQVSQKTAYQILKVCRKVDQTLKKVRDEYTDQIVKKYGVFDEKGNLTVDPQPWGFKLQDGVQANFEADNEAFHRRELELDCLPLTQQELMEIKTSAAELSALGLFFQDPELIPTDEKIVQLHHV